MSVDLKQLRFLESGDTYVGAISVHYGSGDTQMSISPVSAIDFQAHGVLVEKLEAWPEGGEPLHDLTFIPYASLVSIKQAHREVN